MSDVRVVGPSRNKYETSPNLIAGFSWTSKEPRRETFSISGPNYAGYTPTGVAYVEHYNPLTGKTVTSEFSIGGKQGPSVFSVITGSLVGLGMGETKIRVVDDKDYRIAAQDLPGVKLPGILGRINSVLGALGDIDSVLSATFSPSRYSITKIGDVSAFSTTIATDRDYLPGVLEKIGIDPNKLPDNLEARRNSLGQFIGIDEKNRCFSAGTSILMADGKVRAIELIRLDDLVAAFDNSADAGRGALIGRRVVRTFVNENQIIIDFHGTKVTPGHAYLCGDGPHQGRFRQIMNIVRDDGAVVLADGSLMRAATGCAVGSPGDAFVEVQIARPARHRETGESVTLLKERGRVRAGTRVRKLDGSFVSFLDLVEANGWTLHADGLVGQGPGHAPEPLLWAGPSIPKPEDYILALSQLTLADLYGDPQQAERPGLPLSHRQGQGEANAVVRHAAPFREDAEPGANDGSARTLVRRARNLLAAKRPKPNRVPKQAGETVH